MADSTAPSPAAPDAALQVRLYIPGDELDINRAFNEVFGTSRSLSEWHWKFGKSGANSLIALTVDAEDRVLVQYAVAYFRLWHGGQVFRAGHSLDSFALRNREVILGRWFDRTREYLLKAITENGIPVLYGFPGRRASRLAQLKGAHRQDHLMSVWSPPAQRPVGRTKGVTVRGRLPAQTADAIWEHCRRGMKTCLVRDSIWLEHMYWSREKHKEANFHFISAKPWLLGGQVLAWAVFEQRDEKLMWLDLLWDAQDEQVLDVLIQHGSRLAERQSLQLELLLFGHAALRAALVNRGWSKREHPEGMYFTFSQFPEGAIPGFSIEEHCVLGSDTDLF